MSWLDGLRHRVRVWRDPRAYARERAEERRFHADMERREGRRGRPPGPEGRPPVVRRPPNPAAAFVQDVRHALRALAREPGFTALAVLTLALGVGANGAVFSMLDRVFGQPAGIQAPAELRRLYVQLPEIVFSKLNYPAFAAVDAAAGGTAAAWTASTDAVVRLGDRELPARSSWVTHDYFAVLGVRASHGRLFGADEEGVEIPRPVAVISHSLWEREFGLDPGVIGRTLEIGMAEFFGRAVLGRGSATVIGVAEKGFEGVELNRGDVFLHMSTFFAWPGWDGRAWYELPSANLLEAAVRVDDPSLAPALEGRATAAYRAAARSTGASKTFAEASVLAAPIAEARGVGLATLVERTEISVSRRIAAVTALLLVIACANVATLLLVRGAGRRQELSVRVALGISRPRLVAQLVTEGLVLAALAGAASILLAHWGGVLLRGTLLPHIAWPTNGVDARVVGVAVGTALGMGAVAGLGAALPLARVEVGAAARSPRRGRDRGGSTLQSGLLVGQAALSLVLLVGAGLFARSLERVSALRLGFDVETLAWVDPGAAYHDEPAVLDRLASRLEGLPGVTGTAVARYVPMLGHGSVRIHMPSGEPLPERSTAPHYNRVSPDFFAVVGMRLIEGRTFEPGETDVAVVSEAMSRLWPGPAGAVGQCFRMEQPDPPCLVVIGVVEDSRNDAILEEETPPRYFLPRATDAAGGRVLFRVDPERWIELAPAVRREASLLVDPLGVRVERMSASLEPQLRPWRIGARLFGAFGVLALGITVVGVYSVMAYAVRRRRLEMGVRRALGAQLAQLVALVVRDALGVLALGAVVGTVVAIAGGRVVASLLYGVTPADPAALTEAAALLLATGALASLVPALRAGGVDPAETLREE